MTDRHVPDVTTENGAAYASLRRILDLAPDLVKLDMGLIRGINADPARRPLIAGMGAFAMRRELRLVAEAIETAAGLKPLRGRAIGYGQGFPLGRPQDGRGPGPWPTVVTLPAIRPPPPRMLVPFVARESDVHNGMIRRGRSGAGVWVRRLTPLAWLFVVLAGLDLVQRLLWLAVPPTFTTTLAGIVRAVSPALVVLLPAAVLVGEPTAWRTTRLLLIGALALVGAELMGLVWRIYWESAVAPAVAAIERVPGEPLGDVIRLVVTLARLAGPVLLGIGLSRLLRNRIGPSSARPTVGAIVVIALGAAVAGSQLLEVLGQRGPLHRLEVVAGVLAALAAIAWAYLAAVALPGASTDGPSRRGRVVLAIGALAFVATSALSIVNTAALAGVVELPSGFFVLSSVLSGVGAVLLIAGFAAGLPSSDATDAWAPESDRPLVESPGTS